MTHISLIFTLAMAALVLFAATASAADIPKEPGTYAKIETTMGTIIVKLFDKRAPKTVQNFTDLAEGKKSGKPYYDGIIFHRVIPNFMVQTGDPTGTGRGGPGYKIADEFHPELKHDGPGVLSMANVGSPNTGGGQFFITVAATRHLDGKHAVFGKVIEGLDVVKAISEVKTGPGDRPLTEIAMKTVTIHRVK